MSGQSIEGSIFFGADGSLADSIVIPVSLWNFSPPRRELQISNGKPLRFNLAIERGGLAVSLQHPDGTMATPASVVR
jgi:hypothetical protein